MKTTDSLQDALQIACLAEGTMHTEELSKQYLVTVKKDTQIDSTHRNNSKHDKAKERVMVNIAPTVASEDQKLEETLTIVGLNTHQKGVLHMAKSVITVRRRDITQNVAIPELAPSLHSVSQERNYMIWSRNPMVLVNTLNLNKMVSM